MNLGLVFKHGDAVLIGVFLSLIAMSIASWVIIIIRCIKWKQAKTANKQAREIIWASNNLADAEQKAKNLPCPISSLALDGIMATRRFDATEHHLLSASLPRNAYLERELRHSMGKVMSQFEGGMTALATIGSTAPFIGLLGTVWGIYRALINISNSGQISIAAVSGPIGEALVATAIGLFTAIPAVLAYNFFNRANKNMARIVHNFAHDWHVQLINSTNNNKE
ncbi:MotA/TolQ/ExbB proton channel family protein [Wielerella bovis]|uniref:MotA/TolQ/ExbB proton channel family protein n=1 Tax=Wielerella bovis TaxID=2917790 RepID=UPI002018E0A9|nr:MotA/TolQ/ExbB proton channel family protein [Wielerella bovis]ULJ69798.1 MotA/TolQ/ExbB proton channel family protein [Wielerella bovis]